MLPTPLDTALQHIVHERPYYRCVLVVHLVTARLVECGTQIQQLYSWPPLSIGTHLSSELRSTKREDRARAAGPVLQRLLHGFTPGPVLCTDINLLFEPSLQLDPLVLLRQISRSVALVVLWPGSYDAGVLAYASAVPPHAHYRTWARTELTPGWIVPL